MEKINNELPENLRHFLDQLKKYINLSIYYYGSIQRTDYLINNSDIDASIFCNDINSTVLKLISYLSSIKDSDIKRKKIIWKIGDKIVYGTRVIFNQSAEKIRMEISIFDEKYKNLVIRQNQREINIPFIISLLLLVVKMLYYKFRILDLATYKLCKTFILNTLMGNKKDDFVSL